MYYNVTFDADYIAGGQIYAPLIDPLHYVAKKDCEIMQYTGLKDKNGKEIYEGDILVNKSKSIFDDGRKYMDFAVLVGFESVGFVDLITHTHIGRRLSSLTNKYFWTDYEIIGNIYENPELLNQNDQDNQTA